MIDKKVWFITGTARGMGTDFAKAVMGAGHSLVATGRDPRRITEVLGQSDNLLAVSLDILRPDEAQAAVTSAVKRFGRIDVLVNNAGIFEAGFFEEMTMAQIKRQLDANLFGQMNVTRAVMPIMRKQGAGHIMSISSTAGLASKVEFTSAYAASKFGLEGWMEALRVEIAPFGIHTTTVNPGFFRTELLSEQSTTYAEASITDYAELRQKLMTGWKATHGKQAGDPKKLAQALLTIAGQEPPPRRFLAGSDAIATAEQKIADLQADIESNRKLSTSLAFDA
jgi:NAD(P)-dependent dehydrogenase (short-subunit alcohol dehydrogenase family)